MSDQEVKRDGNGRLQRPGRSSRKGNATPSLRQTFGNVIHHAVTLTGLQLKLLEIELKQLGRRMAIPVGLALAGMVLMAACFPIGLAGLAFYLMERTGMSNSTSFFVAAIAGALVSAALLAGAGLSIRKRWGLSERSRHQMKQNLQCVKNLLKRSQNG